MLRLRQFQCAMVLMFAGLIGAAPATQPGLKTWFDQLADRDPDVRERARVELMGISRQQLPELERIVAASRPLRPSQVAELHDIVTHVYLAGEPYDKDQSGAGFLGLSWMSTEEQRWEDPPGLVIRTRIKGFSAYRHLREGDVLVGIVETPEDTFTTSQDLQRVLLRMRGGARLNLLILRGGRVLRLPITINTRPNWNSPVEQQQLMREKKADEYWESTFAKLVSDAMTAAEK